ncbi:hypothetical protein [Microbacterium testaceum]|uniref:hypothetical protein n=1 Tax=Microbacterium testaceum TaxID=2033 RepID=UPI001D172012|nr:hypothetical protein [Microbacterium testaceum]MCC4250701.1 hypothetical protein [Microbacterium testaceum]
MITRFLVRRRDAAGDAWWQAVARVPVHRYDPKQEARARRAERRVEAWDALLTAWRDITRPNR